MNGNRNGISVAIFNAIDMIINLISVLTSYTVISYYMTPAVDFSNTTILFVFVMIFAASLLYQAFDINRPVGFSRLTGNVLSIIKANFVFFALVFAFIVIFADSEREKFLLLWAGGFALLSTVFLLLKLRAALLISRLVRKNGFKLRKVIIVGDNTATTKDFVKQVTHHGEFGMMIIGYVGDKIDQNVGCEKLGSLAELGKILDKYAPTDVVFAMDAYDKHHIIRLVNMCDDRCIKVYFLPVIYGFFKNQRQIEQLGTLPIINIHSTPLDHPMNAFMKRIVDIIGSILLIILTSPIMIGAAIAVKISSPGPVFFTQERVGKLGRRFTMLKFRSMRVNVGSAKTWTTDKDPRKTRVGNFLRKSSIDELPQLFNVLAGSMSLVGPRPEVPYYVDYFKTRIPLYMVKHYVKPGITGLAQINGLRGDTSIEDRIHCDLEYIEKWSIWSDFKILLMTPMRAFNKHEVYAKSGGESGQAVAPTDEETQLHDIEIQEGNGKRKILYVASTMSHINNFHTRYIEKLREDGNDVHVMANGEGADYNIPFEKKLFSSINTACRRDIARIMRREYFDAIVLNTSLAAFHVRLAIPKDIKKPRVVNIVHGYLFSEVVSKAKRLMFILCEKFLSKRTDAILVMNNEDMQASVRYGFTSGKTYMTRGMGADVRPVITPPEKLRADFRLEDRYVIAFVGELSERKNQEFLIKAHAKIKKKIPGAALVLVGDGAYREYYESVIDELDLADSVILMGHREDACDVMRMADLYVSASTIEGMPFNIIEALGCGKTVLASRVKGHTDLIEDRKSGFFFSLRSEDEYVDKVCLIHSGVMKLDERDIYARYKHYSKDEVFSGTYTTLCEALDDEK